MSFRSLAGLLTILALLAGMTARPMTVTFADEPATPDAGESVGQQSSVLDEEPTATPAPTETPLPTDTPTPAPTATPEPTATPAPTDTPTPEPTATATPTPDEQPSLTLILTAKDDGEAPGGEHLVDFGHVAPDGQEPTADGVTVSLIEGGATYLAASAVTVTVTSNGLGWTGSCSASSPGYIDLDLAWTLHGSGDDPVVFASDASGGQGCIPTASDGTTEMTYTYDYQLTVTWDDPAGTSSSTITYTVTGESSAG